MPSVKETKNRLSHDVFRALVCVNRQCSTRLVDRVDPCFFAYCILKANKIVFLHYFEEDNLDSAIDFLINNCVESSRKKTVDIESVTVHPFVGECILLSKRDPVKVGTLQIFYKLLKYDRMLSSVSAKFGISPHQILEMINKEARKQEQGSKSLASHSPNPRGKKSSSGLIEKYCVDLTERASSGMLQPVFCRESEMEQVLIALMKKNKANPLLIGEPGVGKTAIVEGLAQRFVSGEVPSRLSGHKIVSLSMASALQGTSLRGQFEERLDNIMKELIKEGNVIVFIDEIHTIIGAGSGSEGALDAGNVMKPYLARGDLRCIGATTFDDYHRFLKKDRALLRRFQRIFVSEPDEAESQSIIEGLAPGLETHHGCVIGEGVFESVVSLSRRFVTDRFFPDKAIDCLDHSCAKSSLTNSVVTSDVVEEVISDFAGVPVAIVKKGDVERLEGLREAIGEEVVGNESAIDEMCNRVRFCCSTKHSRKGPMASIALFGPKGVGKKTAVSIMSNILCGKDSLLILNGAEFSEPGSVARIIGSPPGYVGFNEETYIIREVRRRPHVVLLVKNVHLMHQSAAEHVRQIVETGQITDVHGMIADFSNCILVFVVDFDKTSSTTMGFSNGAQELDYLPAFSKIKNSTPLLQTIKYQIGFTTINSDKVDSIVRLEMENFKTELENGGIMVDYDEECLPHLVKNADGSPSAIRSTVRERLELALCQGLTSKYSSYHISVQDNRLISKVVRS